MTYETRYGWGKLPHPTAGTTINLAGRPAIVYRLYGKNSRLLYVGCSVAGMARVRTSAHGARYRSRRPLTAVKVEHYATWEQASTVEAEAIATEAPVFNRKPGRVLADPTACAPVRVDWLDDNLVPLPNDSGAQREFDAACADLRRAQARYDAAASQLDALLAPVERAS